MGKDVDMCELAEVSSQYHGDDDSRLKKKHVWFGLMALLIVLITAAGLAVGAYFFHTATRGVREYHTNFRDDNGNEATEDIESDVRSGVVMHHIRQRGKQGWIIHDFERDIAVIKVVTDDGETFGCFASPLNDKDAANPKSFDEGDEQAVNKKSTYMMGAENPIKDPTFLGKKVVKLCVGVDVYWSMPACDEPEVNESEEVEPVEAGETDETTTAAVLNRVKRGWFSRAKKKVKKVYKKVKEAVMGAIKKIKEVPKNIKEAVKKFKGGLKKIEDALSP